MIRRFFRDSVIYGASAILGRGLNLLLVPFYTRVLEPRDYGLIDIATVFVTLASLTVALEISQALARFLPDADDREQQEAIASTSLLFSIAAYGSFAFAAYLAAEPLEQLLFGSAASQGFVAVVIAAAAASGVFSLVLNQLRWQLLPLQYAIASLTFAVVSIAVTVVLVLAVRIGVTGVMLGQVAGTLAGLAVAWRHARRLYRFRFDPVLLRAMLRFSLPLVPSSIGVFVTLYIDRIAIRSILTFTDVGLFGIGFRVASIVTLAMVGFQAALTPLIYSRYREPGMRLELSRIFRSYTAFAILLALALAVFAPEILALVTTPEYLGGAVVVPLLAPALVLATMYAFAPGLAIAKRTGMTALLNLGGAVMNTALNLALIPILGIQGAAIATLASNGAVFAGYMLASQRIFPVPHAWGRIALGTLVAASSYGISTLVGDLDASATATKLGLLVLTAAALVAIGLVRTDELVRAFALVRGRLARSGTADGVVGGPGGAS